MHTPWARGLLAALAAALWAALHLQLPQQQAALAGHGGAAEEAVLRGVKLGGHLLHLGLERSLVCGRGGEGRGEGGRCWLRASGE